MAKVEVGLDEVPIFADAPSLAAAAATLGFSEAALRAVLRRRP